LIVDVQGDELPRHRGCQSSVAGKTLSFVFVKTALRTSRYILPLLALCVVSAAWIVPQSALAAWMQHPHRVDAVIAAQHAAAWARVAWTLGACALCLMPWLFIDAPRTYQPPLTTHQHRLAVAWLVIAMLLAVLLRFFNASESLWYDEIAALATYTSHGPGVIMGNAFTTANHPLQSLLSLCALVVGVEPWIRLPSILSGACAVLGVWWISRATAPTKTSLAICMAMCMAIMPAAVNAGSEARGYGLMIAASSMSTGLALMALKHGGSWRWKLYALVLALGVWAHFVTAMVGAGHALFALWLLRNANTRAPARRLLMAIACAAVLSIALWGPALPDVLRTRSQFAALRGDEPTLWGHEGFVLLWQQLGMGASPLASTGASPLARTGDLGAIISAIALLPLLLIGAIGCLKNRDARRSLAATALALPLALLLVWCGGSWFYGRFMLFSTPATALIAGVAVVNLASSTKKISPFFSLIRSLPIALTLSTWSLAWFTAPRQPIREAVAFVAAQRTHDQVIVGIGIADDVVQWYALSNNLTVHATGNGGVRATEVIQRLHPQYIIQLYPQHTAISSDARDAMNRLGNWKQSNFQGWIQDGDVVVWSLEKPG